MIRVAIERSQADRRIRSVHVSGHAEFAEPGKDIVCAGVSAVSVGTVNAIHRLLDIRLEHEMDKGLLDFRVPDALDEQIAKSVQLLLESMVVMLQTIQTSYGQYITIRELLK